MKGKMLTAALLSMCSQALVAGEMGPAFFEDSDRVVPFITVEGQLVTEWAVTLYMNPHVDSQIGGGRLAAGITYPYKKFRWSVESGWADYGSVSAHEMFTTTGLDGSPIANPVFIKLDVSGPDLLGGISYQYNKFDFFFKAGTLFNRGVITTKGKNFNISTSTSDTKQQLVDFNIKAAGVDVLPEIKVGFFYDFTRNLSGSFAYMHAFGSVPKLTGAFSSYVSDDIYYSHRAFTAVALAPLLDVFSLGLKYSFKDA